MNQFRTSILNQFRSRVEQLYGPTGRRMKLFRAVERGPWSPLHTTLPHVTIVDDGQHCVAGSDGASINLLLNIKMMIEISGDWTRRRVKDDWSDIIYRLIKDFHNWRPGGAGVLAMNYRGDDPFDVILTDTSASGSIWVIEFECEYFDDSMELFDN